MISQEINPSTITGTTEFNSTAEGQKVTRSALTTIPPQLMSSTRAGPAQDLKDFLAKPVLLSSTSWAAQIAGATLVSHDIPETPLAINVFSEKVKGFLGFKGTAHLRVQVNGNKFQAGRLLVVFVPQGQVASVNPAQRIRSLMAATQLPRIELDLSSETEVEMEIPYISPTPFYNRVTGSGPMGQLKVLVYSPIATGTGSTTAEVTVWCSFSEVELAGPIAQMGDSKPRKKKSNPTDEEKNAMGLAPISSGLSGLSRAANALSAVPVLSSFTAPAAWALDIMAGVASAFGYSKPSNSESSTKINYNHQFHMANFNGTDNYPSFGVDGQNTLSVLPGFAGTDVDEMTLAHLVRIPAYFGAFSWTTAMTPDTLLYSDHHHPNAFINLDLINAWSVWDMPPVSYFSQFFHYWRGGFIITLKVVKTGFHSGRLLFSFDPSGLTNTNSASAYVLREVIDIREQNEFKFFIPYVNTNQYQITGTRTDYGANYNSGRFTIRVLNDLVAPDTVSSSVQVLMEVSGADDYELATPKPHGLAPIIRADVEMVAQMNAAEPRGVGNSDMTDLDLCYATNCIGEKVTSVLQLLKRYSVYSYDGTDTNLYSGVNIRPFLIGYLRTADAIGTITHPTGDYYSLIAPCFAYVRGSIRTQVNSPPANGVAKDTGAVTYYPDLTDLTPIQDLNKYLDLGLTVNYQPGVAGDSFLPSGGNFPSYQQLHTRLCRPSTAAAPEPVDEYSSHMRACFENTSAGAAKKYVLYRAAGDDMTLGYFTGTPACTDSFTL